MAMMCRSLASWEPRMLKKRRVVIGSKTRRKERKKDLLKHMQRTAQAEKSQNPIRLMHAWKETLPKWRMPKRSRRRTIAVPVLRSQQRLRTPVLMGTSANQTQSLCPPAETRRPMPRRISKSSGAQEVHQHPPRPGSRMVAILPQSKTSNKRHRLLANLSKGERTLQLQVNLRLVRPAASGSWMLRERMVEIRRIKASEN
mmetsp:Transcript_8930/g.20875  ORF Transcript_8930/g.20875 Transcript_8930/m.20875 type:complete len:200 (+) Transcript_8930:2871-3470(+)